MKKTVVFVNLNDEFVGYIKDVPCEKLHFTICEKGQATVFENKFVAAKKVQEYISKINWLWCKSVKVRFDDYERI
jgi:hypothetical protein